MKGLDGPSEPDAGARRQEPTALVEGAVLGPIRVADGFVYFSRHARDVPATLERMDVATGVAQHVVTDASVDRFCVGDGQVYWFADPEHVKRVDVASGIVTDVARALARAGSWPAFRNGDLFWYGADTVPGSHGYVLRHGTTQHVMFDAGRWKLYDWALQDPPVMTATHLYSVVEGATTRELWKTSLASAMSVVVPIPLGGGCPIELVAADGADAFVTTCDRILRVDGVTDAVVELASGLSWPRDLVFDGSFLYAAEPGPVEDSRYRPDGRIVRIRREGGAGEVLATGQRGPGYLAVTGSYLVWMNHSGVLLGHDGDDAIHRISR